MEALLIAIKLLGGLAMFLYGMEIMGDGLKNSSGTAMKNILGKLTQNAVLGVLTGALVTAVIQSSTATIVLTVGLIGAGILNLKQAVSIVLGANIGTTVTAQIIRLMDVEASGNSIISFFKTDTLAPIALVIGIILVMFVKKQSSKNIGAIAMGFGILFSGLNLMTDAVDPLANSPAFGEIMTKFGDMPLLGILIGLVLTVIVQSSSATVGILQVLASAEGSKIIFDVAYPIIMGINLGTCVTTAMVCSVGTSKDAKRTGVVHIVFNTIGTILFMIVMTVIKYLGGFPELWGSLVDSGSIANFQTLFNLITAVVLLPFTGLLVKISGLFVRDTKKDAVVEPEIAALDAKLMISPAIALGEVRKATAFVANLAKENVARSLEQFKKFSAKTSNEIVEMEERLDHFTDAADVYLIQLSGSIENEGDKHQHNMLMQCIRDIERIGDYATNFNEIAEKLHEEELSFSKDATYELSIISDAVQEILRLTVEALENDSDYIARRIEPLEEVIDDMVLLLKTRHTDRLCRNECSIQAGLYFANLLMYLERTADQCSSIAMLMLGRNNEAILKNHHAYLQELHNTEDQSYLAEHQNRRAQYLTPLENMN